MACLYCCGSQKLAGVWGRVGGMGALAHTERVCARARVCVSECGCVCVCVCVCVRVRSLLAQAGKEEHIAEAALVALQPALVAPPAGSWCSLPELELRFASSEVGPGSVKAAVGETVVKSTDNQSQHRPHYGQEPTFRVARSESRYPPSHLGCEGARPVPLVQCISRQALVEPCNLSPARYLTSSG